MVDNPEGRPPKTKEELDIIFRKLEPFLKSGRPLYKACLQAGIPKTAVYDYYNKDTWFTEKIDAALAYSANLINNLFFGRLVGIATKANKMQELLNDLKADKIKKEDFDKLKIEYEISDTDWAFIWRYATTSHIARDEYGVRQEVTGKDGLPLVPETSTREVAMLLQAILQKPDEPETKPEEVQIVKPPENTGDTSIGQ